MKVLLLSLVLSLNAYEMPLNRRCIKSCDTPAPEGGIFWPDLALRNATGELGLRMAGGCFYFANKFGESRYNVDSQAFIDRFSNRACVDSAIAFLCYRRVMIQLKAKTSMELVSKGFGI